MKSGTTTLYHDLGSVRGIFMPLEKEPEFLCTDAVLEKRGIEQYARQYSRSGADDICGDASTGYSKMPDKVGVPQRAKRVLGADTRILYLVRDPVQRLVSHHRHESSLGLMPRDINEALDEYPRLVHYSSYRYQLQHWLQEFGERQLKVETFERYVEQRAEVVREIIHFLGVEDDLREVDFTRKYNADPRLPVGKNLERLIYSRVYREWGRRFIPGWARTAIYRSMLAGSETEPPTSLRQHVQEELIERFQPDADWLAKSFGIDLSVWASLRGN